MADMLDNFYMLRIKNQDGPSGPSYYYKGASGTSGATPKLYTSKNMANAVNNRGGFEVVKVKIVIEENY